MSANAGLGCVTSTCGKRTRSLLPGHIGIHVRSWPRLAELVEATFVSATMMHHELAEKELIAHWERRKFRIRLVGGAIPKLSRPHIENDFGRGWRRESLVRNPETELPGVVEDSSVRPGRPHCL